MSNSVEFIRGYIDNELKYNRIPVSSTIAKNTDRVKLENGEEIIITSSTISITGTERSKPQIRVFSDGAINGFELAKREGKRFFWLTIYKKPKQYVDYMSSINLEDYIISIETEMKDLGGRLDIRSMYEWLDLQVENKVDDKYLRCSKKDHSTSLFQASFIKIQEAASVLTDQMKSYLSVFDMRPYYQELINKSFNYQPIPVDKANKNNIISFGAPGTGKSYYFNKKLEEDGVTEDQYERVTFYADYSYSQFVGTYKPVDEGDLISYKYVPGPFMRILTKSLESGQDIAPKKFYLIIEEINRARAASVFGDTFQLLDRSESGDSEYSITFNKDARDYLAERFGGFSDEYKQIKIPNNMVLWATMNSADQGVFPIDTAFKRRWNFKYIGIDDEEFMVENISGKKVAKENQNDTFQIAGDSIEWNVLRRAINAKLSNEKLKINEDKLIGPFFIKIKDNDGDSLFNSTTKDKDFIKLFSDKVLMYLFEDAVKTKRNIFFEGCDVSKLNRYSYITNEFSKKGIRIFGDDFKENYYDIQEKERNQKKIDLER